MNSAKDFFFHGMNKKDVAFSCVVLLVCLLLYFIPTGFEDRQKKDVEKYKALVTAVDNSLMTNHGLIRTGAQSVEARLLDGKLKGRIVLAQNHFLGKMEMDKVFQVGDHVLVNLAVEGDTITWAHATDYYRLGIEFFLLCVFGLFLLVYGGFTGFQALLSFFFTGLVIWKLLLPSLLKGYNPIVVTFLLVSCITAVILFLVSGLNKKGVVAFLGACSGLAITCVLAMYFAVPFKVNGAVRPFSETLLFSGFMNLNLTGIFIAGIFLASSGAVMDIAMDLSSAMQEIVYHRPSISRKELFFSAIMIGRAVIGSMTTTLVLAYSGGYITMLMLFMGQGIANHNILNLNYVAAEILHTLVGSFGLVLVAPLTATIGALLYVSNREPKKS